ncbi:unnamed protein product [Heligmosomoides polygyrus]|uniref:HYPK_UBA domain-containing protein n=1 Tax=Heligmosomoides polygyrus TaxID=6339 RepID=A0A3P8CDI5_HELPZ|nr:unnamed protein product [Heligmosomoides polygyrus]
MLVDEDEFIIDQLDSSYGYAPKNYKKRGRSPREETEVEEVDSTLRKEDGGSINPQSISSSFLRTELNAESVPNFGEETMIRAGCSAEAVALARQLDVEPPKVSELTTKVNKEDAELLTTQLDKELYEEWRSSSLLGGLGVDHSGLQGHRDPTEPARSLSGLPKSTTANGDGDDGKLGNADGQHDFSRPSEPAVQPSRRCVKPTERTRRSSNHGHPQAWG